MRFKLNNLFLAALLLLVVVDKVNATPPKTPKVRSEWLLKWYSPSEKKVFSSLFNTEQQCKDKEALFRKALIHIEQSCTNIW